ncbi:hypothetical protein R83H12_00489 [Fibrobacteria bacterium R8-3-H12]
MNLSFFEKENLFEATKLFFNELNIVVKTYTREAQSIESILGKNFEIVKSVYVSYIDENSFENLDQILASSKYKGILVFSLELNKENPRRKEIADLTRAFNRKSKGMPVCLLLKYGTKISLALSERVEYKQEWREGEKIGKVIILRDIDTEKPHAGHLRILEDLKRHNVKNFSELYNEWLKVLNIKTLNNDFYKRLLKWYELCFNDIQINLESASKILDKKIDDELKPQAVIRVIIRLMFIWFMKEKKLIRNIFFKREFSKEFLKKADTYYNAILQNLFFAVLNKKIDERRFRKQDKDHRYDPEKNDYGISDVFRFKDFFNEGKAEKFLELTKTIPFVNGGLFTCHDYIFSGKDIVTNEKNSENNYIVDGFSERKNCRAKISDDVIFELIDLFNSFVFTVEESTPTEQDIALDPELLGTVFENLIGFYNPETKENARKQTGSFYTPREIVDYMCNESLKESLKTKFPNLHQQIDKLMDKNEDYLNFPEKNNMLAAITDLKILDPACGSGAFPMGMFNLMVRTVEKLQERKTTYKNKLDIITNCIYGVDIQNIAIEISKLRFFISLLVDYETPEKIENFDVLPNLETKFIVANTLVGIDLKNLGNMFEVVLLPEFEKLTKIFLPFTTAKASKEKESIKNAFNEKKEEVINNPNFKFGTDTKDKIHAWNPFNVCYSSPFFDSRIMFGIKDGFDVVIGNPPYIQLQGNGGELAKLYEKCNYKTFARTGDIYCLFYERGYQLLKPQGRLCFITSNKWMRAGYGEDTRKFLAENTNPEQLIDFAGAKVFEEATVDVNILMFAKDKNRQKTQACIAKKEGIKELGVFVMQHSSVCNFGSANSWVILSPIEQSIKKKIEDIGTPLKEWDINIYRGILTGYNEAFVIDGKKKDELIAKDPKSAEIIRPILRGRDIKRYGYDFADLWLINTHNGIKEKGIKPINIDDYPAIKKHLDKYYPELEKRQDKGDTPYNLRNCAYTEDFFKQKIIYPETTQNAYFAFDNGEMFIDKTCFMLISKNAKYIQATLSSKLFEFAYKTIFSSIELGENGYQYNKHALIKLPILIPNKEIIPQVEKLLEKGEHSAIDTLIYKLYGLDKEEIKVIESQ